jgi:hypothetical protein
MQTAESIAHSVKDIIHDDINLVQVVIPGLTKPAPYLIRGNPVFFPPGQRPSWAGGWIPAFAGMTPFATINLAVYKNCE